MQGPIQSVEVSYVIHATEDHDKVRRAVSELVGSSAEPEVEVLEGHYGNEIRTAKLHLKGEEANSSFNAMVQKLPEGVKSEISSGIGALVDEHSALFIRLDKQRLVSGDLALGSGDSVRVKVKPRIYLVKGGAAQFYLKFFGRA